MVLALSNLWKVFPDGTMALQDVSLAVRTGHIHGLAGANGAGKSTLIKILSGDIEATAGHIVWRGQPASWTSPRSAAAAGISAMQQHVPLFGQLSVLENAYISRSAWLRRSRQPYDDFSRLCAATGIWIDPDVLVDDLSVGERQVVALLQAISSDPDLLILDEPTASLSYNERQALFKAIAQLRAEGTTILYISHFLDELLDLTDDITVLRDGAVVHTGVTKDLTVERLAELITGGLLEAHDAPAESTTHAAGDGDVVLDVRHLSVAGAVNDVSFTVGRGEIVGIAGLLGSGRSELLHGLLGAERATGEVLVDGSRLRGSIAAAIKAGMGFVPEDRQAQGLLVDWSIARNVCLPWLARTSKLGLLTSEQQERAVGERAVDGLSIRAPNAAHPVRSLSGGNAQKVLFGRWLPWPSKVLLLDEPMRGIDVGAKRDIADLIRRWADDGMACLVVDSEFEALLEYADRILVLRNGRIVWSGDASRVSEHDLLLAANGLLERVAV